MEIDVVKPLKPKFYNRYVDDICSKELKNQPDQLFEKLKHYQLNINSQERQITANSWIWKL